MLRGHDFLPDLPTLAMIPVLYATERVPLGDKTIHLHYFIGGCDWYIAELDTIEWRAFGYVDLGDPQNAEWGYIDLQELEAVWIGPGFVVERDLGWSATPFGEVCRSQG